jgi:hypothetical protein
MIDGRLGIDVVMSNFARDNYAIINLTTFPSPSPLGAH